MTKTSMEYWFPLLEAAGIPVPKTLRVTMPADLCTNISMVLYGEKPDADPREHPFFAKLNTAAVEVGMPCFLRTGQTSAKHSWDKSCYVADINDIVKHVYSIAEFSEIADIIGLAYNEWFVRELLPSIKYGVCPRYGNMPVAREFRCFVDNGAIRCIHPYWPLEALRHGGWEGTDEQFTTLSEMGDDEPLIRDLALRVSTAIEGAWSVDVLATERGWYVTDMAEANRSYHWEGCTVA